MSNRSSVGDLLATEFADVSAVARRVPRPTIASSTVPWAILAAFGASLLTFDGFAVALSVIDPAQRTFETQLPTNFEISTAAATAMAFAVAWRAGGVVATEGYLALIALERLLALPRTLQICSDPNVLSRFAGTPFAERCTLLGQLTALWPLGVGALLALALIRVLGKSRARSNGALEAAGALALAGFAWSTLLTFIGPDAVLASPVDASFTTALAVSNALVGGIVAGLVLARRSPRPWRAYAILAAVLVVFFAQLTFRYFAQGVAAAGLGTYGVMGVVSTFSPLVAPPAAAIALSVSRRRLAPR